MMAIHYLNDLRMLLKPIINFIKIITVVFFYNFFYKGQLSEIGEYICYNSYAFVNSLCHEQLFLNEYVELMINSMV